MKRPTARSEGEERLALHLKVEGIAYCRNTTFHPTRKWRADFMLADKILIEVDGGNRMVRNGKAVGRHIMGDDYTKTNEAVLLGFRVLRFTPAMVKSGEAIDTIRRIMA